MDNNEWIEIKTLNFVNVYVRLTLAVSFILVLIVGLVLMDSLRMEETFFIIYIIYVALEIAIHEQFHRLGGKWFLGINSEIDLKWSFYNFLFGIKRENGVSTPTHPFCKPKRWLNLKEKIVFALSPFIFYTVLWTLLMVITGFQVKTFIFALTVSWAFCHGDFWAVFFSIYNKHKYRADYKDIQFADMGDHLVLWGKTQ
ncbi:hypothetical protein ACOJQI_02325 [Bacillus salacetis]|uniref:hypothetical protein n=1 Tax=Bacillus salacetis TaxID=2315464 RepID=UPI003BA0D13F